MVFVGFWICVGMSFMLGEPIRYAFSWESAVVIALSGGLICANAFLSNYGVARVEGIVAGNILTLECVFGVLLGYLVYREIPQIRAFAGGGLIVGSVLLMNYLEVRRKKLLRGKAVTKL
jgi:drug/metabolite transporter (DMT)-like permease